MDTITLQYTESGTSYTNDYDVLMLRGFDDIDEVRLLGVQHPLLNGGFDESFYGFQRIVTVDFGILSMYADREFLSRFVSNGSDREIQYNGLYLNVSLEDPQRVTSEWVDNLKIGQRYKIRFIGRDVEKIFTQGSGYGFDYGTGYGTAL